MGTSYSCGNSVWIQEEHFHNEKNELLEYSPQRSGGFPQQRTSQVQLHRAVGCVVYTVLLPIIVGADYPQGTFQPNIL